MTSPGATIALGFMFMKSNNAAVAGRLEVPTTHFLLDYVRPDFLLLRVMCRGLVLWDSGRHYNICFTSKTLLYEQRGSMGLRYASL